MSKKGEARGPYNKSTYKPSPKEYKTRFAAEWEQFKIANNYSSDDKALEAINSGYNRNALTDFKDGRTRNKNTELFFNGLRPQDALFWGNLFHIRPAYLMGLDDYRTQSDYIHAIKRSNNFHKAIHNMLLSLGYIDLDIDEGDMNLTMPLNTVEFIKKKKEEAETDRHLVCDVNANRYIELSEENYKLIEDEIIFAVSDIFDHLLMSDLSKPVPTLVDSSVELGTRVEIPLISKDGDTEEILVCDRPYIPTGNTDSLSDLLNASIYTDTIFRPVKESES